MARTATDISVKKNSKLEAFLKKNLNPNTYERVRCYESCIVCSEREDKAFKYVILGDEWIYLTENPPKKIYEAVHLKDVISVDLVNDFPSFLSGEERENTQHITINYCARQQTKNKKKDKQGSLTARSSTGNVTARSLPETSHRLSVGPEQFYQEVLTARESKTGLQLGEQLTASLDASLLRHLMDSQGGERRKSSSNIMRGTKHSSSLPSKLQQSSSEQVLTVPRPSKSERRHSSGSDIRPLPQVPSQSKSAEKINSVQSSPTVRYGAKGKDASVDEEDYVPPPLEGLSEDEGDETELLSPRNRRTASKGETSQSEDTQSTGSDKDDQRKAVLHLYILSASSPILALTQCAWNSYILRGTLLMDPETLEKFQANQWAPAHSEKLESLFCQLKQELLNPANTIEDVGNLVSELKAAAEKNMAIKKLFWKEAETSELFTFLIKQLKLYLPKSPVDIHSDTGRASRADEFELLILLVETLSLMFRETEIVPSRLHCLRAGRGKVALDLVMTLTCFPELPVKYVPPPTSAAALMQSTQADQWRCRMDIELAKLLQEFTSVATSVMYELLTIAGQSNWGDSKDSFFNAAWLINALEQLNTTEKYLERVIGQAMRLVGPSKQVALTPGKAVLVYQQFYVLDMVVTYSPKLLLYLRNNFYEEFKYYLQQPVILLKFPPEYLISSYALHHISKVMSAVLQRKIKIHH